jgi:hypothetical protein
MYTPLRKMLTRHVCGVECMCPVHGTPLIYSPAQDDHACQDITCEYGHGMDCPKGESLTRAVNLFQGVAPICCAGSVKT